MTSTVKPPATEQKRRCAGLTRKGRPCKARPYTPWTPFCWSHLPPRGPVEFTGGGPLDGLAFFQRYQSFDGPEMIGITRSRKGRVVVCEPGSLLSPGQYSIGVYRFRYNGLIPEWQWEPK